MLPLSLWALVRYRSRMEAAVAGVRDRSADVGSYLIEALLGMKVIVAFNAQEREASRFRASNDAFIDALMSMRRLTYLSGGVPGLLLSAGSGFVFLVGGMRVIDHTITMGTLVAFVAYQMRLVWPIQALMGLYASLASARVSLRRVSEILDARVDVVEVAGRGGAAVGARARDARGRDVRIRTRRPRARRRLARRVARASAWRSSGGAGKASRPSPIFSCGSSIRTTDACCSTASTSAWRAWRTFGGTCSWSTRTRSSSTRRSRRTFGTPGLQRRVRRSAPRRMRPASARCSPGLPRGLDTSAGERGRALSAGERQRLALARAFLADPAVLVLDEATGALDPATEAQVAAGYEAVMAGRTTIIITHRLDLARRADRVLVLERGRIVEEGTAAVLLGLGQSFANLFSPGALAETH